MRVCEIFSSIQGESTFAGSPCAFVRLTGCNLRCTYCDTAYAYEEGREMETEEVIDAIAASGLTLVEITGGEPLMQSDSVSGLTSLLLDRGYRVLIETNGSLPIGDLDRRAVVILDIKTPSSGMSARMDLGNLRHVKAADEVKFVMSCRHDYEWSREMLMRYGLPDTCTVLFSPVWGALEPRQLGEWIIADRLPVRLNLQLHKYLYGPNERGV
ncbi:MAG: radical SAM protein [Thermodesulfovibrionales bacterium]